MAEKKPIVMGLELDFDILKENWNKYKTEDGSILKIKNPTIKVFKTAERDSRGNPIYRIAGISMVVSIVPDSLKSNPSQDETVYPSDVLDELKFTVISEDWSEYKLSDGIIFRVKTVVNKISRTKKFNEYGEPIYWINWQVLSDKIIPK
jgi:hypothetical protein